MADERDLERLYAVAIALEELGRQFVFTGGSITSLLITDPAAPATRLSDDVDAIVRVRRSDFHAIEARLRQLGFEQRPDQPICRWFRDLLILDVMPDDERILGFSNRWYTRAYETAETIRIKDLDLRVVGAVWFLATKIEAFIGRGKGDYQGSRDLEDFIAVIDGRAAIVGEIASAPEDVRLYLADAARSFASQDAFLAAVVGHLGGDDQRAEVVIERLTAITLAVSS